MSTSVKGVYVKYQGIKTSVTTGKISRSVYEIVLYDERGAWITNYRNENTFEFKTKRKVSIQKYLPSPDYSNPNGFLCRRRNTIGEELTYLFLHVDNLDPDYSGRFLEFWEREKIEAGAIKCSFSLKDCSFMRIVSNPRIKEVQENVDKAVRMVSSLSSYQMLWGNQTQSDVKKVVEELNSATTKLFLEKKRVNEELGIMELIHENGADKPIGESGTDWNDISVLEWR